MSIRKELQKVLLFVETGLKTNELARLTRGSVDLSDRHQPQVSVKRPRLPDD